MRQTFDPFAHGWLLLQMRCPALRAFRGKQHRVKDLCESYSEVVLYLEWLRTSGHKNLLGEYGQLCIDLEQDVYWFLVFYDAHPEVGMG
ncbi:hypothetical protein [Rhizobium sp. IBUN]|uniref:hypothetical protein n=1 Tax=Rhizobium sp. IBUN TaxID=1042326 RepID=UPI0003FEF7A6|nr:hypothetical protein [Rhizobium sp. IBUN]